MGFVKELRAHLRSIGDLFGCPVDDIPGTLFGPAVEKLFEWKGGRDIGGAFALYAFQGRHFVLEGFFEGDDSFLIKWEYTRDRVSAIDDLLSTIRPKTVVWDVPVHDRECPEWLRAVRAFMDSKGCRAEFEEHLRKSTESSVSGKRTRAVAARTHARTVLKFHQHLAARDRASKIDAKRRGREAGLQERLEASDPFFLEKLPAYLRRVTRLLAEDNVEVDASGKVDAAVSAAAREVVRQLTVVSPSQRGT